MRNFLKLLDTRKKLVGTITLRVVIHRLSAAWMTSTAAILGGF